MNSYTPQMFRNSSKPFQNVSNLEATCDSKTLAILREELAGELMAISQYDAHANQISNDLAKQVLRSIRDEERVHAGELLALIEVLCPEEATLKNKGKEEIMQMMAQGK